MAIPSHSRLARWTLVTLTFVLLLACRTLDLVTGNPVPPASQIMGQTEPDPDASPTLRISSQRAAATAMRPGQRATFTPVLEPEPTEFFPTDEPPPPSEPPPPTEELPTRVPPTRAPTRVPPPTAIPTDAGPTVTPAPTRCPQTYCVVYHGCQPDAGNTMIEGVVYNNGVPENGVVVRVAKEAGAYPLVDDFVSGNDPVNPGKKDPNNPGRYILQIVAGAPREGNWWVFVIDKPNGTKVLSQAQLIHTNDDPYNPVNCQHAFVDFVR